MTREVVVSPEVPEPRDQEPLLAWFRRALNSWTKQVFEQIRFLIVHAPDHERTAAEVSAGVTPTNYQYPPGDVRRYGAVGDGSTDDTTALQNALNSGHKYVFGSPTHTYLVSFVTTTTINSVAYRYCLSIPSGVVFDLGGATVKLDDGENAAIVAMLADDAALDRAVLDGNRTNQTAPAAGEMACILAYDVDRIQVRDVRAKNVRQYAARFLNCRNSVFYNLRCDDSYGDGWSFGTSGSIVFECSDCVIDEIYAQDCEGTYSGLEGNAAIFTVIRCQVGRVAAKDCSGGFKIQNTSSDSTFGSLLFDGDDQTFGGPNCGTKFQGASGSSVYPTRCIFNSIVSVNCFGNGLFIDDIETVQINSYTGYNNGSGSGASGSEKNDVELSLANSFNAKAVQIGQISVDSPAGIGVRVQGSGNLDVGRIEIRNPTGIAVQDTGSGRIGIGHILALDDAGTPTMTYAFRATGSSKGRIGLIETNLTHSTSQSRVGLAAAQYDLRIDEIRLGSTDVLSPVVQLTNGATSTTLTNGHLWRDFVGGSADYLHPILRVEPWDTSAKALSGNFGYTITDGSSGTGGTITHPSAGAADYVKVTVVGWQVVSQASS